jgi:hypothetical protein
MSRFDEDGILTNSSFNGDLRIVEIGYDPNGNPNSQRAVDLAAREGLDVKYPAANELFIDIDNEHSYMMYQKQMDIMRKYVGASSDLVTPSRHGLPGRHIVVTLQRDITEVERIALQACLGSDRVRELLGFIQNHNNDPHPTLFLEAKEPAQNLLTTKPEQKLLGDGSA